MGVLTGTPAAARSSHLFQRVASFLLVVKNRRFLGFRVRFSSLSESGFIPTLKLLSSSATRMRYRFSSLSESGFIPTNEIRAPGAWICLGGSHLFQRVASFLPRRNRDYKRTVYKVLISFREWLHSYINLKGPWLRPGSKCSHLFQRVASFLRCKVCLRPEWGSNAFSSLSESGFIPTL